MAIMTFSGGEIAANGQTVELLFTGASTLTAPYIISLPSSDLKISFVRGGSDFEVTIPQDIFQHVFNESGTFDGHSVLILNSSTLGLSLNLASVIYDTDTNIKLDLGFGMFTDSNSNRTPEVENGEITNNSTIEEPNSDMERDLTSLRKIKIITDGTL
jgi:hypothetical protein